VRARTTRLRISFEYMSMSTLRGPRSKYASSTLGLAPPCHACLVTYSFSALRVAFLRVPREYPSNTLRVPSQHVPVSNESVSLQVQWKVYLCARGDGNCNTLRVPFLEPSQCSARTVHAFCALLSAQFSVPRKETHVVTCNQPVIVCF
jgi:hypothetical protein